MCEVGPAVFEGSTRRLRDRPGRGRKPVFSPEVAMYVVKIACERPDDVGRWLSLWDCTESCANCARRPGNVDLGGDGSSDPAAPSSQALAAEDVAFAQSATRRGVRRTGPGDLRPVHPPLRPMRSSCASTRYQFAAVPTEVADPCHEEGSPTLVEHDTAAAA